MQRVPSVSQPAVRVLPDDTTSSRGLSQTAATISSPLTPVATTNPRLAPATAVAIPTTARGSSLGEVCQAVLRLNTSGTWSRIVAVNNALVEAVEQYRGVAATSQPAVETLERLKSEWKAVFTGKDGTLSQAQLAGFEILLARLSTEKKSQVSSWARLATANPSMSGVAAFFMGGKDALAKNMALLESYRMARDELQNMGQVYRTVRETLSRGFDSSPVGHPDDDCCGLCGPTTVVVQRPGYYAPGYAPTYVPPPPVYVQPAPVYMGGPMYAPPMVTYGPRPYCPPPMMFGGGPRFGGGHCGPRGGAIFAGPFGGGMHHGGMHHGGGGMHHGGGHGRMGGGRRC